MSSRGHRHRDKKGGSDTDMSSIDTREILQDVVLVVNGKHLKTNSTLLAHNSPAFAKMIVEAKRKRDMENETEILYDARTQDKENGHGTGSFDAIRIEVPSQSYSDVKIMVKAIQNHDFRPDKLTGEKALKLLPLTDQFKMKYLRKKCKEAIIETLEKLLQKHSTGSVPSSELFKYLSAAEKYKLYEVKEMCLEECSKLYTASYRATVVDEKHISDKSKTEIINRMCDRMTSDYEKKLTEIRQEFESRYKSIQQKRDEFMEVIRSWKEDLKQEVDVIIRDTRTAHSKLTQEFEQKRIVETMMENIQQNNAEIQLELKYLKTEILRVAKRLQETDIMEGRISPEDFWETLRSSQEQAVDNIEIITEKFSRAISKALVYSEIENLRTSVQESFSLQENFDNMSVELSEAIKSLSEAETNFQQEMIQHESTKVKLMKSQKREHEVNTWIKWAKP